MLLFVLESDITCSFMLHCSQGWSGQKAANTLNQGAAKECIKEQCKHLHYPRELINLLLVTVRHVPLYGPEKQVGIEESDGGTSCAGN